MRISDWSSDVCSSDLRNRSLVRKSRKAKNQGRRTRRGTTPCLNGLKEQQGENRMKWIGVAALLLCSTGALAQEQEKKDDTLKKAGKIGRASCRDRGCQYV